MPYVNEEIESVQLCTQCYNTAFDKGPSAFALSCDNPHPIVWATPEGWPEWPAKLMAIRGMVNLYHDLYTSSCTMVESFDEYYRFI